MPHPPLSEQGDPEEYDILALNMINGKGYNLGGLSGNFAYYLKDRITDPTARRVPLYPMMIAFIYLLIGRHFKAVFLTQALIDTLTMYLIYLLAKKVFKDEKAGLISSILYLIYIPFLETCHVLMSENLYAFFLYAGLLLFITGLENHQLKFICSAGIVFGLAHLTRPDIFYVMVLFLILLLYSFRKRINVGVKNAIFFSAVFLVIILPWIIRNYMTFNRIIITTTLEGEVLAWEYLSKFAVLGEDHEQNFDLSEKMNELDEVSRNDFLKKKAIDYYLENPVRWLKTLPIHILNFWFGNIKGNINFLYYATTGKHHAFSLSALVQNIFLFVLTFFLFIKYFSKDWFIRVLPILIVFLFFHFTETFKSPDQRHFIPLVPSLIVLGSYPLHKFYLWINGKKKSENPN